MGQFPPLKKRLVIYATYCPLQLILFAQIGTLVESIRLDWLIGWNYIQWLLLILSLIVPTYYLQKNLKESPFPKLLTRTVLYLLIKLILVYVFGYLLVEWIDHSTRGFEFLDAVSFALLINIPLFFIAATIFLNELMVRTFVSDATNHQENNIDD